MLNLIKTLHQEFLELLTSASECMVPRSVGLPDFKDKANVAIGMRRVGKTYVLLQKIKALLASGAAQSQILYIDFEDDRILPLSQKALGELLDSFYSLYPENHDQTCYLFLDEIQTVEGWPLVIRRYLNTKNVKIYLTGSSAKLLSKEIDTAMRGRSLSVEVWPYSFLEYLSAKAQRAPEKSLSQADHDKYAKLLMDYLAEGGFPGVVNQSKITGTQLLKDYVNIVTYRDIIERHKITNTALIKRMIAYLLKNAATTLSVTKYFNDLKSQGFQVGRATIYNYLSYIEDAYLAFSVPLYDESIRKVQHNPQKIYAIDMGLSRINRLNLLPNYGRLFENLIYLDLRRRGDEVYYYLTKNRYEVDFLTRSLDGQLHLYQVAWDVNSPATKARELRALEEAEKELGIKGTLITFSNYFDWLRTYPLSTNFTEI